MDPKASAKSKRAHTLHGRTSHPSPSAIAQRKKQSKEKKPAQAAGGGGGGAEGPKRSNTPALPSNWDRYEDEDEATVDSAGNPPASEVAAPKSKGADFRYLVEEARSQQLERDKLAARGIPVSSPSDEFSFDFVQDLSSMLSIRGKGLLSMCEDDNFIIDDDDGPSNEVPFLTIDLNAIDAQLSKLKLSERLFIEADLFPEEQDGDELKENQTHEKSEVSLASEFKPEFPPTSVNADGQNYNSNYHTDRRKDENALLEKYHPQILTGHTTKHHQTKEWTLPEKQGSNSYLSIYDVPNSAQNTTSNFEVATAEAELDMLLDSLNKTNLSSIAGNDLMNITSQKKATSKPTSDVAVSTIASSFRNITAGSIDDLLDETSLYPDDLMNTTSQKNATLKSTTNELSKSSIEHATTSRNITASSIDDLLAETSFCSTDLVNTTSQINDTSRYTTNELMTSAIEHASSYRNITANLNDDLLAETSVNPEEQKSEASIAKGRVFYASNRPSHSALGLKSVDGPSPMRTDTRAALDDALDDLLGETTVFLNDQITKSQKLEISLPSQPSLVSKSADDFDFWLDTL